LNIAAKALKLNEENVKVARRKRIGYAWSDYRLNQSNSVEIKQAQGSYEDAYIM
jgi:hypothetical protein